MRRRLGLGATVVVAAVGVYLALHRAPAYRTSRGATLTRFTLHSVDVHRDLHEILVTPKRHSHVMLVLLHGRSYDPSMFLTQPFFDALSALRNRAPTVLLLDGGNHSYWHDRKDGKWGSMVVNEAIPAGARRTRAQRVAIGGVSMGGYGALLLGAETPVCAIAARSPALWFHAGDSAPGAFDDAEDYARHDIVGHPPHYRSPIWIDIGTSDPFHNAAVAYAQTVHARLHIWPGGHTTTYWREHELQYLSFVANACG